MMNRKLSSVMVCIISFGLVFSVSIQSQEPTTPILTPADARAHGFESLRTVVNREGVPLPNLNDYVKNITVATQLGKALFYEMATGSDGVQSCASCHFNAGADNRSQNQLNPNILRVKDIRDDYVKGYIDASSDPDNTFEVNGPNYTLMRSDFPFVKDIGSGLSNGKNVSKSGGTVSPAFGNSNDVASSQGVLLTYYNGLNSGGQIDKGTPLEDATFNVTSYSTRRVEPRNTPTVLNSVFNFSNFWDGRANNNFNSENPFGKQDKVARIFRTQGKKKRIIATPLNLSDSSLASQAVGPPLSHFEMSFGNGRDNFRTLPEVGRKLLNRRALETQEVDATDSVLGRLRHSSGLGLTKTYETFIKQAFKNTYWDSPNLIEMQPQLEPAPGNQFGINNGAVEFLRPNQRVDNPNRTFTLMESNFGFFYGISLMLYQSTLVTDQTPFDKWMEGNGASVPGFGKSELEGLNVFVGDGNCASCHSGPEFTSASVRSVKGEGAIEAMLMGNKQPALYDNGYYNIGVTPTVEDLGRGGADPFGAPLAFARQYAYDALGTQPIRFGIEGDPLRDLVCDPNDLSGAECISGVLGFIDLDFGLGFFPICNDTNRDGLCSPDDDLILRRVAVDGAFKTPGLRNVDFTGPYFHNGSAATLMEVVEFYDRGGNFCEFNSADLDPAIQPLDLTPTQKTDLVNFMLSLTDQRVVSKSAPFDHPSFMIPDGHPVDENQVIPNGIHAEDKPLTLINGSSSVKRFLILDAQDQHLANHVAGGVCSSGS